MCRWMAWLGQPLVLDTLLFEAPHGVGVGWYGIGSRGVEEPVPEATALSVRRGGVLEMRPFTPQVA